MRARALAAGALWALAALQIVWHGWLAPAQHVAPAVAAALAVAPLLPCLAAWWWRPRHGLLWGATVALLYFAHGVMEAWAVPAVRVLALAEVALCLALIGGVGAAASAAPRAESRPTGCRARARRATVAPGERT